MVSNLRQPPIGPGWSLVVGGIVIFSAGLLARGWLGSTKRAQVIESPRTSLLPKLSAKEKDNLPYPPDALPGARDVASPYGSIRVYEWGPEDGQKVLLIHGISTPCLALGSVAHTLADNGRRVMLFDLFGRGYSDTPSDLPQDVRLFTAEILTVLASSSLSWTGSTSGGFSLVGYSLGGGISIAFTSYFPRLVNSLVLIAPAGLIRPHHFGGASRLIYSEGLIPESILNRAVKRRLQTPLYPSKQKEMKPEETGILAPVKGEVNIESNSPVSLSKKRLEATVEAAVRHQVINHEGFVTAFMSSIRKGPISEQHKFWKIVGRRLTDQHRSGEKALFGEGLEKGKVFIVGGSNDAIINRDELMADATEALEGNVQFEFMDAGHEVPVAHGELVAEHILKFWS